MPNPIGFLQEIRKEAKVIKGAPFSFAVVCFVSFSACWAIFELDLGLKSDTIQSYKEKLSSLEDAAKSGASKSGQSVIYLNDPNVEKLRPSDTNAAAFAYGDGGNQPLYTWSVKAQMWK